MAVPKGVYMDHVWSLFHGINLCRQTAVQMDGWTDIIMLDNRSSHKLSLSGQLIRAELKSPHLESEVLLHPPQHIM